MHCAFDSSEYNVRKDPHVMARELACPPFEDVYIRAFVGRVSPRTNVEYDYVDKQSIPTAGLSPASPTALWAAAPDLAPSKEN
jgi:hypothetical protein